MLFPSSFFRSFFNRLDGLINYDRLILGIRFFLVASNYLIIFYWWQPPFLKSHPGFSTPAALFVLFYGLISIFGTSLFNYRIINLILSLFDIFTALFEFFFLHIESGMIICFAGVAINALYNTFITGVGLAMLLSLGYTLVGHFNRTVNFKIYLSIIIFDLSSILVCAIGLKIKNSFNLFELEKEESKKRLHRLQASARVVKEITGELELEKLLVLIVQKATELTHAPAGGIIVKDEEQVFRLKAARGIPKGLIDQEINQEDNLTGKILSDKKTVFKNNEANYIASRPIDLKNFKNALASPIISKEELLGAIFLLNGHNANPFTKDDQLILETFCEHAAVAKINADVFRTISTMSLIDYLTGVGNIRYFFQQLNYNLSVAERYRQPCSLMIVDSDCLKQINDQYGNTEGFRHIKIIAEILKNTVRSSDFIARYDRDMFMVILPHTDLEEAVTMGKRIQIKINESPFVIEKKSVNTTVCIGIASYPTDASDSQALTASVETALRKAKQMGKNVLVTAQRGPSQE